MDAAQGTAPPDAAPSQMVMVTVEAGAAASVPLTLRYWFTSIRQRSSMPASAPLSLHCSMRGGATPAFAADTDVGPAVSRLTARIPIASAAPALAASHRRRNAPASPGVRCDDIECSIQRGQSAHS